MTEYSYPTNDNNENVIPACRESFFKTKIFSYIISLMSAKNLQKVIICHSALACPELDSGMRNPEK